MKSFIKISLIAALLMSSVGLYASEADLSFSVKHVNEKAVTFFINETQVIEVSIYDATYEVLYEKKINAKKGSSKTYDLTALPDGNYTIRLKTELKDTEYKVQILGSKAVISEPLISDLLNPVLTKRNEVVTLNLVNAPEGPIEVKIFDQNNGLMYNKVFEGGASLVKRFNVAKTDVKELTFIVTSANQVSSQTVKI